MFKPQTALLSLLLFGALSSVSHAQHLKIAFASEPTAADPHYHEVTPNRSLATHMFETLADSDTNMALQPMLAESWKNRDDLTWEIKLRPGVTFSNGEPFKAKDVVFSLCRVMNNETGLASGYTEVNSYIDTLLIEDDLTLVIKTKTPAPLFINELSNVPIIWSGLVSAENLRYDLANKCGVTSAWPTVSDFNSGKATIGTGPYVLKTFTKGVGVELTRNDSYWGAKPEWSSVSIKSIPTAAPRLTGLLSGEFDLIENPAARDVKRIQEKGLGYVITPSFRVIYLQLDVSRAPSPQVVSPKGAADNPLKDLRVRQALSMSIDRQAIVDRIMDGAAAPAYQFLPDSMFGALNPAPKLIYDPEQAKKLLAEAGYPNGFDLTITGTNDRYINDSQILQTLAQYFNRIGVKTKVDALSRSVFFPRRYNREFSAALGGWGSSSGEASSFLRYWVANTNESTGMGGSNYGGFNHPEFERVFGLAMTTMDNSKRQDLLRQAVSITVHELPHLPLHFESSIWGFRKGLTFTGHPDQRTTAMQARSQ